MTETTLDQRQAKATTPADHARPVAERITAAKSPEGVGDPRIDFERDDYWACIPAGYFLMGAQSQDESQSNYDPEADDDESPVHGVSLDGYRIARYAITVGQYRHFIETRAYKHRCWWKAGGFGRFVAPQDWHQQLTYPSRPVVGVSWWEAAAYCAWSGYCLPTEVQWERAARGTTARKYPWGDEEPEVGWKNYDCVLGHPTPVGFFPRDMTPEGVWDMGGNVWEWCGDPYAGYTADSVTDAEDAFRHVIRGGSWADGAACCRAANRIRYGPEHRDDDLGFRVVEPPLSRK